MEGRNGRIDQDGWIEMDVWLDGRKEGRIRFKIGKRKTN